MYGVELMTSVLDNYRKRVLLGTKDRKEKLTMQSERTFERQLKESPSSKRLKATLPGEINILENTNEIDCIILDVTNNDIKSFDQKYLLTRKDEDFDIGCYVEFDGTYWLAAFREHRVLDTHKKFTLYKCNNIWNYKKNGNLTQQNIVNIPKLLLKKTIGASSFFVVRAFISCQNSLRDATQ